MFFDIEDAIVERLNIKLAGLNPRPRVYDSTGLDDMQNRSQMAASVFVAYNGLAQIAPMPGDPSRLTAQQLFMVWTCARSAKGHDSRLGVREASDPILVAVLEALCGWRPVKGKQPLVLSDTPAPAYDENGFGYFPLAFTIKQEIRGNPS